LSKKLNLGYDIFESVMGSREVQAKNLAKYLVDLSKEYNLPVVIHGKSYKPRVPYVDGSYSLLIGHYCAEYGVIPSYVDKYTGDEYNEDIPAIFLLAHSATTTYKYWDSPKKDEMYCNIPNGSIVVDPWRKFTSNDIKVIHYGNTRAE
jgi:UDPglucose 6-dehydrogenase